jgi:hypothetical protein
VAKGIKCFSGGARIEARTGKTSQQTATSGSKIIIIIIIMKLNGRAIPVTSRRYP